MITEREQMIIELTAIVVYLRVIGVAYPVAPEVPITTLLQVIKALRADNTQLAGPAPGVEGGV